MNDRRKLTTRCEVRGIVILLLLSCLIATAASVFVLRALFFGKKTSSAQTSSANKGSNNNNIILTTTTTTPTVSPTLSTSNLPPFATDTEEEEDGTVFTATSQPTLRGATVQPVSTTTTAAEPTSSPTAAPFTLFPTASPIPPTLSPIVQVVEATATPSTTAPTNYPTYYVATDSPTYTFVTDQPTYNITKDSPTYIATDSPTQDLTASPTNFPTFYQTDRPTPTPLPRIPESDTFRIKLYWEPFYFWQGEEFEMFWCMECTKCTELNFSSDGTELCSRVSSCKTGDQIWIEQCDGNRGFNFQVSHYGPYDQIRVANTNLCLERTGKRHIVAIICTDSAAQLWSPLSHNGPFELRPANDEKDWCITQQHHPKSMGLTGLKRCSDAHKLNTGYWETYQAATNNHW